MSVHRAAYQELLRHAYEKESLVAPPPGAPPNLWKTVCGAFTVDYLGDDCATAEQPEKVGCLPCLIELVRRRTQDQWEATVRTHRASQALLEELVKAYERQRDNRDPQDEPLPLNGCKLGEPKP